MNRHQRRALISQKRLSKQAKARKRQGLTMPRKLKALDPNHLYIRQEYEDQIAGGVTVLVPVSSTGDLDESRAQICLGWTQIAGVGKFQFLIPTSNPTEACGPLWLETLEKALDHFESEMRRQALAQSAVANPREEAEARLRAEQRIQVPEESRRRS